MAGKRIGTLAAAAAIVLSAGGRQEGSISYVYAQAARYDPRAWVEGRERFPSGAALMLSTGTTRRALLAGFCASADAAVSFDASKVLFAGKRTPADRWQIWEAPLEGGTPRRITNCETGCIRPLYLPEEAIVYTRLTPDGSYLETAPLEGGKATRLTFGPARVLAGEVLRDGRILFETVRHGEAGAVRELFTVYPDGTGVESLRCDHTADRSGPRQVASGEVIFSVGPRLARFASAYATQQDVAQPARDSLGPIAEISPGVWLIALRGRSGKYALCRWSEPDRQLVELEAPPEAHAVQPVLVAPRVAPKRFPSALVPEQRTAGNLLCLDARIGEHGARLGGIRSVRVSTRAAEGGAAVLLGETPIEPDGSFYVQVPGDRPLRIELLDQAGKVVRGERGGFWMRPAEQRVCVGCHAGPEMSPENKVPMILDRTVVPVRMMGAERKP